MKPSPFRNVAVLGFLATIASSLSASPLRTTTLRAEVYCGTSSSAPVKQGAHYEFDVEATAVNPADSFSQLGHLKDGQVHSRIVPVPSRVRLAVQAYDPLFLNEDGGYGAFRRSYTTFDIPADAGPEYWLPPQRLTLPPLPDDLNLLPPNPSPGPFQPQPVPTTTVATVRGSVRDSHGNMPNYLNPELLPDTVVVQQTGQRAWIDGQGGYVLHGVPSGRALTLIVNAFNPLAPSPAGGFGNIEVGVASVTVPAGTSQFEVPAFSTGASQ